jgi:hypothetical protein
MNATFLGFKWVYIKKINPTIPNNLATMRSHESRSKAYWMIINELCRTLTMLVFLNPTMQSLCEVMKFPKDVR